MIESGGKHYGDGMQPWDLQRYMQTWGSVFLDARRTDVIEYLFRKKGDKLKQLEDARKALHNIQVIIAELEKEDSQLELKETANLTVFHSSHKIQNNSCVYCGKYTRLGLSVACIAIVNKNES